MGICQMPLLKNCFDIYSALNEKDIIEVVWFGDVYDWLKQVIERSYYCKGSEEVCMTLMSGTRGYVYKYVYRSCFLVGDGCSE